MANLLDYLDWRGDLTLRQSPFNEVDNLILAELSFIDFSGIVPAPGEGPRVPLWQAAQRWQAGNRGESVNMGVLVPNRIPEMLRRMAETPRFRDMELCGYREHLDTERAEQFAVLTILCGDGTAYFSFRGTDDTLAGWKEDFYLSCMAEVPAQKKAVAYTKEMARLCPRLKLRLGGHSKGGNLAVWAGVFAPAAVQRRICAVWSNDGPGFRDDILSLPQHRRLEDRIHTIVPKSSVVGMLLEHEDPYTVIKSRQLGIFQHDPYSWEVQGGGFVVVDQVTQGSRKLDQTVKSWLDALTPTDREVFLDGLYQALAGTQARSLDDLAQPKNLYTVFQGLTRLDEGTRTSIARTLGLLAKSAAGVLLDDDF